MIEMARITSRGFAAFAAAGLTLALLVPAQAQFWGDWGGGGGRYQRQQRYDNPFGGWFSGPRSGYDREREVDYSRAPAPAQKKPEATTSIVVMGDANADWLAYGLEDAFSEKPEIAVVRKHRTDSGLIRYDQRRDTTEWPQVAREVIAAEKPKFIVVMIGNNDRQAIREKAPLVARANPQKPNTAQPASQPAGATPAAPAAAADPEQQAPEHPPEQPANLTPEQAKQASGPWEFHTEKWELAYIRRVDAMIAALKSAGVPVLWVGLPSQRGTKASADSSYLNEIYRSRAEKAGITYVDIWDGFVDEAGKYSPQGPDYEGQIRRLRSGDGVYFTKFGARKLAHYVDREMQRIITNRGVPVALPVPIDQGQQQGAPAKPGAPAQRPNAGPVLPLTATNVSTDELLGSSRAPRAAASTDASANRVLTKGEPVAAPSGRADDFSWPRGSAAIEPLGNDPAELAGTAALNPGKAATPAGQRAAEDATQNGQGGEPKRQRRARRSDTPRPFSFQNMFRW